MHGPAAIDLERDESVPAGDTAPSSRARILPSIQTPSIRARGLHHGEGIRSGEQRHRDRSPAPMMREFHHRGGEEGITGHQTRHGLVLDVATEQQTWYGVSDESDGRDDGLVVDRAALIRPIGVMHHPAKGTDLQRVASCDLDEVNLRPMHPIEPIGDRRRPFGSRAMKKMWRDDDFAHVESSSDVEHRVEVIGVRMGHDDRVDPMHTQRSKGRDDDPSTTLIHR